MAAWYLSVLVVVVTVYRPGDALKCYTCADTEINSESSFIKNLLGGKTDKTCEFSPSSTKKCGDDESCGFFDGSVTFNIPLAGKVTTRLIFRDCFPQSTYGCTSNDRTTRGALKAASFLAKVLSEGRVDKIDARACACNYDWCNANICEAGFRIANFCVKWWHLGVAGGGLLLLISICCCCCCYCCCRKTNYRRMVEEPHVTTVVFANPTPSNPTVNTSHQGALEAGAWAPAYSVSGPVTATPTGKSDVI